MTGLPVRTERLVHIYHTEGHDVAALSGVDLDVRGGELVGLLGPSGAGKSTLLSLLGGMFRPSAGKIFLGDAELSGLSERDLDDLRATRVSIMLQGAARNLVPYRDPEQNVAFAQRWTRRRTADLPAPREILAAVGLADHAHVPLAALSAGQLQLAAVAVALAPRPGLLLADEPTSQLDHAARDTVLQAIARANRELGTTVLLVTHDPAVAQRLPRTVTIRDGKIGGEGRLGEEYAVVTADGFLPLPAHALPSLPPGTLVRVRPVPEGFLLEVEDPAAGGARVRAPGPLRVDGVEVRYGDLVAVRTTTFVVPPGGMLAVTGPSGAGKSSLLWALAGATAHAGTVEVDGVPVARPGRAPPGGASRSPRRATGCRRSSPPRRTS